MSFLHRLFEYEQRASEQGRMTDSSCESGNVLTHGNLEEAKTSEHGNKEDGREIKTLFLSAAAALP